MICNLFPEPTYFIFASGVPTLLYYSHIPAIILALLVGIFIFFNGRKFLLNQLLLVISVCFSLWAIVSLIAWTNIHSDFLLFIWTFYGVFSSLISIFCIYFIYVFLEKKDVSYRIKCIFLALLVPVFVLAPTYTSLGGFNITTCDAFMYEGVWFKAYYTALEVLAMLWIHVLLIQKYRTSGSAFRKQIILMGTGIEFFMFSFFTMVFLGTYLASIGFFPDSSIELYGMFGMTVFMVFIGILMVRFKTFNVGLAASQVLVVALVFLIGSQLVNPSSTTDLVITAVTLVLTGALGLILVRSVRKEIELRERVQLLAKDLEMTNKNQEGLLHFVTHEIKGYLTKSEAGFASIAEGDYGQTSPELNTMATNALAEVKAGVSTVMEILTAANLKRGTMTYSKGEFDLKQAVLDAVQTMTPQAAEKHLSIKTVIAWEGSYIMQGDAINISSHVLRNLIDNAVRYTPTGEINVELTRVGPIVRFVVKDTGVGITPSDMSRLFTEGGHGKDSQKVNVHSTGYGLYIAKQIVDAHHGKIWAESEGAGKGSKFIVELPVA